VSPLPLFLVARLHLVLPRLLPGAFAELKRFLSNELCCFKEELKRQNDERWSINQAVKKIRLEKSARHSFNSKGNEEQFYHQEKVATFFESALQSLHSGKILECSFEEYSSRRSARLRTILMRKGIVRFLKSQREKKKAKKASKFKPNSRRLSPRYSNDFPAFPSMSSFYLCGKSGRSWRSCYRPSNSPASGSNAGYTWQR